MALGAIKALQQYGYNKGDKAKTIIVIGVEATPEGTGINKERNDDRYYFARS